MRKENDYNRGETVEFVPLYILFFEIAFIRNIGKLKVTGWKIEAPSVKRESERLSF